MANKYLLPIYKTLYDCEFSYENFNQRLEMQKAVYLLQEIGVPIGDYGFRWYLHGPYSQDLQDDMHYASEISCDTLSISKEYSDKILQIYELIHSSERGSYHIYEWVECLASLHFLKENIMSFNASDDDIVNELEKRKKHLYKHDINMSAYRLMEDLFS